MAGIATVLWRHVLRIDPAEPGVSLILNSRHVFHISQGMDAKLEFTVV